MALFTDQILAEYNRWQGIRSRPSPEALKHPEGVRAFKHGLLEYTLGRAHPILPGVWVVPLVSLLLSKGTEHWSALAAAELLIVGILSWTVLEYLIHRFVFHFPITSSTPAWIRFTVFMMHGYHHEYPNDPKRLVMLLSIAWPLCLITGTLLYIALGPALFYGLFPGVLLGYLGYDWVHYYTHHFRPKTYVGKYLRAFHAIHHFADATRNFGISSPIWDWVSKRAREPKLDASESAESRGLGCQN